MIQTLIDDFFGSLDFSTNEGLATFLFGLVIVVGVFNLLKLVIKTIFK